MRLWNSVHTACEQLFTQRFQHPLMALARISYSIYGSKMVITFPTVWFSSRISPRIFQCRKDFPLLLPHFFFHHDCKLMSYFLIQCPIFIIIILLMPDCPKFGQWEALQAGFDVLLIRSHQFPSPSLLSEKDITGSTCNFLPHTGKQPLIQQAWISFSRIS